MRLLDRIEIVRARKPEGRDERSDSLSVGLARVCRREVREPDPLGTHRAQERKRVALVQRAAIERDQVVLGHLGFAVFHAFNVPYKSSHKNGYGTTFEDTS